MELEYLNIHFSESLVGFFSKESYFYNIVAVSLPFFPSSEGMKQLKGNEFFKSRDTDPGNDDFPWNVLSVP